MNIGLTLKTLRKMRGASQETVANALHIERSTYSKLETNKVMLRVDMGIKIAEFYGFEFNYFALCLEDQFILKNSTTARLILIGKSKAANSLTKTTLKSCG